MKAQNLVIAVFIVLAGIGLVSAWDPFSDFVFGVFKDVVNWGVQGILDAINTLAKSLIEAYKNVLLWNPDPAETKPMSDDIIKMLVPVYVIAIMITGFYWLFLSISPRSRAQAKGMLLKLLISMPLVMSSTAFFQLLLDLSSMCVNFIFSLGTYDISMFSVLVVAGMGAIIIGSGGVATPVLIIIVLLLIVSILVVSVVRYLALLFMASIFPLIIFLYLFDLTKDTGSMLMRYTLMLIFMPVLQAFFIVFTMIALSGGVDYNSISLGNATTALAAVFAQFGIIVGGFIMIIVSPFIMLDLMKWLGLAMVGWVFGNQSALQHRGWGQVGHVAMFTGALLAGEGAGALPLAGTLIMLDKLSPHAHDQHHQIGEAGRRYWDRQYADPNWKPSGGGGVGGGGGPKPGKAPKPKVENANTVQDHLDNAREYARTGNYEEANKSYKKAMELDASGAMTMTPAQLGMKEKRAIYTEMSEAYMKMAEKAKTSSERTAYLNEAMEAALMAQKLTGSGATDPEKARLAKSLSNIGGGYERAGQIDKSAKAYKSAYDLDPNKPEYALKYADILYKKG